ncbi:hypothetical protein MYSTI_00017 [Myxococcus stipitatus DSM 14675]|uniref:Uncharacterized protein n=1 Tax=Myxococcus stipitatus (strain DSM 14675 / JCM 12634 / Mx s8) TaxID=1278073 RepID=L7TXX0_MYXSD|nr:tetratricopeptide repeat protein [Myxococcus stipitatus]AGC41376.1 hypothetical protein MYSTI_00017 [Myxococcus stipitatus DSM 14675]
MRALTLLFWLFATQAWGVESPLTRAEQLFDALAFDEAATAFQAALKAPGTREERTRAWRGLAICHAVLGQRQEAQEAFEALLVLDPGTEVKDSLGPKVQLPFQAAKAALMGRRATLTVTRMPDGRVVAVLEQPRSVATEVMVAVRVPGAAGFSAVVRPPPGPVSMKAPPERAVEAYAVARDAGGVILFEQGTARAPLRLEAVGEVPAAVASAREGALSPGAPLASAASVEEAPRGGLWPYVVGGVGLAAAGVVLGVVLTRPESLVLPVADRSERLP